MDWLGDLLTHDWIAWYLLPGIGAAMLALLGWRRERARKARTEPDAVGLLDWVTVTFWASFAALVLFAAAFKGWLESDVPIWP
jgi:membrane protein required for beta-lactamase induction